jgi:aspartyl-tRNA(Asn)/glutamyl-tRNA(Gln) amidotransferase subunit B
MEKGMVRCDVNVSVRPEGSKELGKKVEIKNMNSFSGARRALEYEIPRQIEVLTRGGELSQETRRWDDAAGITETMRSKEMAHDYRYFPEPDLMPFEPTDSWLADVRKRVVELPLARKQRFMRDYQLPAQDAEVFKINVEVGNYFEAIKPKNPKAVANLLINNLLSLMAVAPLLPSGERQPPLGMPKVMPCSALRFKPEFINELVELVENGKISSKTAADVLQEMYFSGESPNAIVEKKGLAQVSDTGAIEGFCEQAIAANPGPAADYKAGKVAALNFLKGQVMKLSKGKANPNLIGEILERKLRSGQSHSHD